MDDSDRSHLERQQAADPLDSEAQHRLITERARVEGEGVYFECLLDRVLWNGTPDELQDLAVAVVAKKLGEAFRFVGTETYTCAGLSHRIGAFEHLASGAVLQLLPGGRFLMGSPESEPERDDHEGPQHEVRIRRPFLMGRFAVSQQEWERLGGEDEHEFRGPQLPIDSVLWDEAQAWLTKAGGGLRLPSEAEWEYACRAGSNTAFCFGENITTEQVNYNCQFNFNESPGGEYRRTTVAVDSFRPNAFGLFQVHGNVFEWCQDSWIDDYQEGPNNERPRELSAYYHRVKRGGGWGALAFDARSAGRGGVSTNSRTNGTGFRVARSIDP